MIDLHIHTTYSDGQYAPAETLQLAKQSGVTVAAITDHDTVSGLGEAETAARELGLQFSRDRNQCTEPYRAAYFRIWDRPDESGAAPFLPRSR